MLLVIDRTMTPEIEHENGFADFILSPIDRTELPLEGTLVDMGVRSRWTQSERPDTLDVELAITHASDVPDTSRIGSVDGGTSFTHIGAALTADLIAGTAEFFSFGTNDLTHTTYGFSRDDIGSFLPDYLEAHGYLTAGCGKIYHKGDGAGTDS